MSVELPTLNKYKYNTIQFYVLNFLSFKLSFLYLVQWNGEEWLADHVVKI